MAPQQTIVGHSTTGALGAVLQAADFNDDGYTDLAVTQNSSPGRVFLFEGGEDGLAHGKRKLGTAQARATLIGANAHFGQALAAADLDGDGFFTGGGRTRHEGSRRRPRAGLSRHIRCAGTPSGQYLDPSPRSARLWHEFVAGDFDGDLKIDLAVAAQRSADQGSRDEEAATNHVFLIDGRQLGRNGGERILDQHTPSIPGHTKDVFAHGLTALDSNGDGMSDLVVSAPGFGEVRGRVTLYRGREQMFQPDTFSLSLQPRAAPQAPSHLISRGSGSIHWTGDAGDALGSRLAATVDYDGDGLADLVISAPGASEEKLRESGRIYIVPSSSRTLAMPAMIDVVAYFSARGEHAGLRLGAALAP